MEVYEESQPWGKTFHEIQPGSYTSFNTALQKVELITNKNFGRMLFLDGVLQSATADEHIYHSALVNAGMRRNASRVLIAGGAEGATAREVLKHRNITHVQMIDWDSHLVSHLRDVEHMNADIWNDSRFHYSGKDIVIFCEETTQEFDTIYIDLLDIDSEDDAANMKRILEWLQLVSIPDAVIVMNVGRSKERAEQFGEEIIEIDVPSFQELWYLVKFQFKR
jgi:spermidine synthase